MKLYLEEETIKPFVLDQRLYDQTQAELKYLQSQGPGRSKAFSQKQYSLLVALGFSHQDYNYPGELLLEASPSRCVAAAVWALVHLRRLQKHIFLTKDGRDVLAALLAGIAYHGEYLDDEFGGNAAHELQGNLLDLAGEMWQGLAPKDDFVEMPIYDYFHYFIPGARCALGFVTNCPRVEQKVRDLAGALKAVPCQRVELGRVDSYCRRWIEANLKGLQYWGLDNRQAHCFLAMLIGGTRYNSRHDSYAWDIKAKRMDRLQEYFHALGLVKYYFGHDPEDFWTDMDGVYAHLMGSDGVCLL